MKIFKDYYKVEGSIAFLVAKELREKEFIYAANILLADYMMNVTHYDKGDAGWITVTPAYFPNFMSCLPIDFVKDEKLQYMFRCLLETGRWELKGVKPSDEEITNQYEFLTDYVNDEILLNETTDNFQMLGYEYRIEHIQNLISEIVNDIAFNMLTEGLSVEEVISDFHGILTGVDCE